MPKMINDHEKELVLEAIYQNTLELIKEKGLRSVTVDQIAQRTNISKGSFYKYYSTKEECLYEVIKRSEREGFARAEKLLTKSIPNKNLIVQILFEIYIAEDSIVLYVTPKEIEALMRKLPSEFSKREIKKSEDFFERTLTALGAEAQEGRLSMGVVAHLMNSLAFLASNKDEHLVREDKKKAMEIIVNSIADYFIESLN